MLLVGGCSHCRVNFVELPLVNYRLLELNFQMHHRIQNHIIDYTSKWRNSYVGWGVWLNQID